MRVSSIQLSSRVVNLKKDSPKLGLQKKSGNEILQPLMFKGDFGQSAGASLGMLAGVAASFVIGPIGALAVAGVGLAAGAYAGDKIEDAIDDNSRKN